jgi:hypothetical protein
MAKTKAVRLTPEEEAIIDQLRKGQLEATVPMPADPTQVIATEAQQTLADAFVSAIERTRPKEKKTVFTRKKGTPWTPKNGDPQLKLKRKMYQHGILLDGKLSNEEIDLLNKVKPGVYCDGWVKVNVRKDRGLDIDYAVRTNAQRLKLINQFGVRSFSELLTRLIDEKANPSKYRRPEDNDFFDLDE